jgi:hypothetical protein
MGTIDKLIPILESKIQEGLEELPKLSVKTEDFTICLNNTLTAHDLLNRIMYKPAPKREDLETKTISEN